MVGAWLAAALSTSGWIALASAGGLQAAWSASGPRPRRLLAHDSSAAVQLADVRSTYGVSLTGSLTPIHTAQHLLQVLQAATPGARLALMPYVAISPCEAITVPPGAHVTLDCGGGTIDLRCSGAGVLLGARATVHLLQCHVLWPLLQPLLTQPDSSVVLEDGASIQLYKGSSSLDCAVQLDRK